MSTHPFQSEVKQLLDIVIHSLYSEREIFLRELISNASDACDKLRFKALTDHSLLAGDEDLTIRVSFDTEAKTITIADNGLGLTETEAVEHLGTIAKSGTKEFLQAAEQKHDLQNLIGQFGVGFYSAFMVAERIEVDSRSATVSSDAGVHWESTGDGNFTTERIARPQRGTTVILHLREDAAEFADRFRLYGLIKRYSDYVAYPILLPKAPDLSGIEDEEERTKKAAEPTEPEQVNAGKALWTRPKDEITDEQYTEFYHAACKQWDEPASRIHFTVEGTLSFTGLLFFPSQPPFDLFERRQRGLSLYVRRVFIMDDCEDLLPEYLRFVRGVVDSDDLPLNVSREMLQKEANVARLRKQVVKRILDHLAKLATSEEEADRSAFDTIDRHFGRVLREGIVNDFDNRDKLAKLGRWQSSWTIEQEAGEDGPLRTSLAAYKERMPEGQEHIYIITAPGIEAARNAPQLEGYREKGYEVLFLADPVDEFVAQHYTTFDGAQIVNIVKGDSDLDDEATKEALKKQTEEWQDFLGWAKEDFAGIKDVRLTKRLTSSPCCIVGDEHGMTSAMAAMLQQHGQAVPEQQRILELNPDHALIGKLVERYSDEAQRPAVRDHLMVLRDQALLAEGTPVVDQAGFARRVQALMASALA